MVKSQQRGENYRQGRPRQPKQKFIPTRGPQAGLMKQLIQYFWHFGIYDGLAIEINGLASQQMPGALQEIMKLKSEREKYISVYDSQIKEAVECIKNKLGTSQNINVELVKVVFRALSQYVDLKYLDQFLRLNLCIIKSLSMDEKETKCMMGAFRKNSRYFNLSSFINPLIEKSKNQQHLKGSQADIQFLPHAQKVCKNQKSFWKRNKEKKGFLNEKVMKSLPQKFEEFFKRSREHYKSFLLENDEVSRFVQEHRCSEIQLLKIIRQNSPGFQVPCSPQVERVQTRSSSKSCHQRLFKK